MATYHFVSTWYLDGASVESVWAELMGSENWPSWWKYVDRVEELAPGDPDGLGRRQRVVFRTALPYDLGFDSEVTRVDPPRVLEIAASGELEGTGRWILFPTDRGTHVTYKWDVRTTKWWMNALAPIAAPAFRWNHDVLMREMADSLGRRLGAAVTFEGRPTRRVPGPARGHAGVPVPARAGLPVPALPAAAALSLAGLSLLVLLGKRVLRRRRAERRA